MISYQQFIGKFTNFLLATIFSATALNAFPAYAERNNLSKNDVYQPQVINHVRLQLINELFFTDNVNSEKKEDEDSNLFDRFRADVGVKIFGGLDLNSTIKLENTRGSSLNIIDNKSENSNHNQLFEDEGVFIERLTLDYHHKNLSFFVGKHNINFGQAWRLQNGIWNFDMARSNYRYNEQIGAGATATFGNNKTTGRYVFSAGSFFKDRNNLDNSLISKRDSYGKKNTSPGDEREPFASYFAAVDIDFDFGDETREETLYYHFAYMNLAANHHQTGILPDQFQDQQNFAANINYRYQLTSNLLADGFVEYVGMNNFNGDSSRDQKIITSNLTLEFKRNWNLTFAHARKKEFKIATNGLDSSISEASAGYKFPQTSLLKDLQIMLGYKQSLNDDKINAVRTDSYGALLRYVKNF